MKIEVWQTLLLSCVPAAISALITLFITALQLHRSKKEIKEQFAFDKQLHISNNRFDMEFSIYKEISEKLAIMIANLNNLFPTGVYYTPRDEESQTAYNKELYQINEKSYNEASKALSGYAIFIPEDIYEKYHSLRKECWKQIRMFFDLRIANPSKGGTDRIERECFQRTEIINTKYEEINKALRNYILSLEQRR